MSAVYRALRRGVDEIEIMEFTTVAGQEQTVGPVARFDTPDGDPIAIARAEACVAFLNETAARWRAPQTR